MLTRVYLLLFFGGLLSTSTVYGALEELKSDNGLTEGYWGPIDQCSEGVTFALDFKFEVLGQVDNTGGNSVKLFCHKGDQQITDYITSTEGNYGGWRGIRSCPTKTNITGFRLRVLSYQGTWGDDQGVDNIQVKCSNGVILDGMDGLVESGADEEEAEEENSDVIHEWLNIDGRKIEVIHARTLPRNDPKIYGDWGSWASCTSGSIAAIETRVEQGHPFEDDAGLADVTMYCI